MMTNESLNQQVQAYLRDHFSIRLDLPAIEESQTDRIQLNFFKSPIGEKLQENRYRLLINSSEELLRKNIVNTDKIKQFGEIFFEVVNQDIQVLTRNEQIRKNFSRIRDQITFKIEELVQSQRAIEEQCIAIQGKEDILAFLQSSLRTYLNKVKVVSEHYKTVNSIQVFTSINIDNLYREGLAQQEDYLLHYQPLLQLMQRLKSSMIKLYQELMRCEYFDLPLKSVNFLANCKNLLLQLQPFLISPDCVFNRLIFHVTKGQKENNRLIYNAFQANVQFTNDIVSTVFKSFYLGFMFQDFFRNIKERIAAQREEMVKLFQNKGVSLSNVEQYLQRRRLKADEIKDDMKSLKKAIGQGKDRIMEEYVSEKQCMKIKEVLALKYQVAQLYKYMEKVKIFINVQTETANFSAMALNNEVQILQCMEKIEKEQNSIEGQDHFQNQEFLLRDSFRSSFVLIQFCQLELNQHKAKIQQMRSTQTDKYFLTFFYPKQMQILQELIERYEVCENKLLNSFQLQRKDMFMKEEETGAMKEKILSELNDYFEHELNGDIGYDIINEDSQSDLVKQQILKIEKVEYMLKHYTKRAQQKQQLQNYRRNLQWLLQVFEGSMDDKILEDFLRKLDFEVQDWVLNQKKIQQLTKELGRYVQNLKRVIKAGRTAEMHPKVFKILKQRIQLYEIIDDMFAEFLLIYCESRKTSHLNILDNGLRLFDQPAYKYVLLMYQYVNKLRAEGQELQEILLPRKTINYLIDELFQPFTQRFKSYLGFSQEQLLNLTLRLEHALNFNLSRRQVLQLFEDTLLKPYSEQYFPNVERVCNELLDLNEQNHKVQDLQNQQVIIHNLAEFKDVANVGNEHYLLASVFVNQLKQNKLVLNIELTNKSLIDAKETLLLNWTKLKKQQAETMKSS